MCPASDSSTSGRSARRRHELLLLVVLVLVSGCLGTVPDAPGEPATPRELGQPPASPDAATTFDARVTRVIDGDTLVVENASGEEETIRLVGVDAPETDGQNSPGEFEGVPDTAGANACLDRTATSATEFLERRTAGERVTIVVDAQGDRRGSYGRLLAYVVVDGFNSNYALVQTGNARVYESAFSLADAFASAERVARADGRGIWACSSAGTTIAASPELALVAAQADAPGDDGEHLNGEFLVLKNRGSEPLDLSGWQVSDEAGHTYEFGTVTIGPGERVILHTGSGTPTTGAVYWNSSSPIWNNDGDVVTVTRADGSVALDAAV
jgi:micrococcal nuclease